MIANGGEGEPQTQKEKETEKQTKPAASTAQETANASGAIKITAKELVSEYTENSVGAAQKYKGKLLEITGVVSEVDTDWYDEVYVAIGSGDRWEWNEVKCYFKDQAQIDKVAQLRKGDTVTIIGTCGEYSIDVSVEHCRLK